jgi:hypothetical protein
MDDEAGRSMHLNEDDLVLHYYGELAATEDRRAAAHLAQCQPCRQQFTRLQRVLGAVDESVLAGDLPDSFERTVWARLEPNLRPARSRFGFLAFSPALGLAAMVLLLVGAAFYAGRVSSPRVDPAAPAPEQAQVRERILLVDLGEHLDRSQMILVELVSGAGDGSIDISAERRRAEDLLAANRLYRQTAASTGQQNVVELLSELERVLVEVAASPDLPADERLGAVRKQIESQGLLFRVRVVSSKIRERQREANQRRTGQRASSGV